jgi:hypothetical protein
MNIEMKYHIVPFEAYRFAIADENEKIIDNAQGYGYKTKQKAFLAMNWKFGGRKQKVDIEKQNFKIWLKSNSVHSQIIKKFEEELEWNVKELCRGEIKEEDIWKEIEKEYSVNIPEYVKKQALK